jgi:hypothetical protein
MLCCKPQAALWWVIVATSEKWKMAACNESKHIICQCWTNDGQLKQKSETFLKQPKMVSSISPIPILPNK